MEPLQSAPEESSFVLLADHQARTPVSFHSGPPVLHYHSKRCKVIILDRDLRSIPVLNAIRASDQPVNGNGNGNAAPAAATNEEEEEDKEIVVDGVDVWVTSDKFLLYAPATSAGVSIPYPSISLHAIQRLHLPTTSAPDSPEVQGLYMQIATPKGEIHTQAEEDEEECITMTIVPPVDTTIPTEGTSTAESSVLSASERGIEDQADKPDETPTQMFYAAVSACSNLHPDPGLDEEDDEGEGEGDGSALFRAGLAGPGNSEGGLPPPVDGSSGWITAENMHEFFDEEGNWIAGGPEPTLPLGPGAGTVREREGEGENTGDAEGENEEAKWRRTD